jgi:hypothetical protein
VQIDNQTDPFSTIVSIQYGDRLGELLDTVRVASLRLKQCAPRSRCTRMSCGHAFVCQHHGASWRAA